MITSPEVMVLWSKKDLAHHLRLSPNHLDVMEREGRLPKSLYVGSSKRWKSAEIIAWIDDGCPKISGKLAEAEDGDQ